MKCEHGHEHFEDITLSVKDITLENVYDKYDRAVEALDKALHVHAVDANTHPTEHTIPIVSDYEDMFAELLIGMTSRVFEGIARDMNLKKARADEDKPFRLPNSGRLILSMRTGKPLTVKEWAEMEAAIDRYLKVRGYAYAERMVRLQTALGVLVNRLEKEGVDPTKITRGQYTGELDTLIGDLKRGQVFAGWEDLPKPVQQQLTDNVHFNTQRTADYITSVSDKARAAIKQTLIQGMKDKVSVSEAISRLFEAHGELNKDWRRIARTENRAAFSDGHLSEEIAYGVKMKEPVYMIGMSAADACPVCIRDIHGQVVKVIGEAKAAGDTINDPHTNTAIWLGKTSVGHKAREHYSVIPRHPHCRCRWVRWYPEMKEIFEVGER